uniref:Mitochondrial ribosomal protein S17 n=1 Tax=Oncorhynchus tshawytscha TaxID=74940 RepID=A0AAZ3RIH7_ONCTS
KILYCFGYFSLNVIARFFIQGTVTSTIPSCPTTVPVLTLTSLLQYYNKRKTYFAHDALQQCTVGDIVLLKALAERRSRHVKHELAEIVYKVGNVVDPLTGKRVAGSEFLECLTDPPHSLEQECPTLTEKLQELNISAATSSGATLVSSSTTTP